MPVVVEGDLPASLPSTGKLVKPEFSDTLPSVVVLSLLVPEVSLLASLPGSTNPEFPWLGRFGGDLPISTILEGVRKNRYKDVMTIRRLQTRRDVDPLKCESTNAMYPILAWISGESEY